MTACIHPPNSLAFSLPDIGVQKRHLLIDRHRRRRRIQRKRGGKGRGVLAEFDEFVGALLDVGGQRGL